MLTRRSTHSIGTTPAAWIPRYYLTIAFDTYHDDYITTYSDPRDPTSMEACCRRADFIKVPRRSASSSFTIDGPRNLPWTHCTPPRIPPSPPSPQSCLHPAVPVSDAAHRPIDYVRHRGGCARHLHSSVDHCIEPRHASSSRVTIRNTLPV